MRLADGDAVEAGHAAAEINILGFQPDATGFAVSRTLDADDAGILGNPNLEERKARNQSQQRPHRAERIAK